MKNLLPALLICFLTGQPTKANDELPGLPADYAKNDKQQRTTGPEHERLKKRVGKWKITTKYAEMFGGQSEVGTSVMKLALNGKFLVYEGKSKVMGTDMTTMGMFGYDTLTKEYLVVNFNSLYTSMYPMTGKMRDDGVIEYTGIMKDAMSPKGRPYRAEEKVHNDDKFEVLVYDGTGQKEFHVMTMTYERIKAD